MQLKPCPFCDGRAEIYTTRKNDFICAYVECTVCGARSKHVKSNFSADDLEFNNSVAEEKIVEAWNMRSNAYTEALYKADAFLAMRHEEIAKEIAEEVGKMIKQSEGNPFLQYLKEMQKENNNGI